MNRPSLFRRTRRSLALVTTTLITLGVAGAIVLPSSADDADPEPIAVEFLTPRSEFTDKVQAKLKVKLDGGESTEKGHAKTTVLNMPDPDRIAVAEITVQPGAQFPWHTHPGPVIVTVAEGQLTYINANDCVERPYPAGTAFVDPGRGNVHTAFNPTGGVTVVVATFFEAPAEGPLTIPADAPADCQVEVGEHNH